MQFVQVTKIKVLQTIFAAMFSTKLFPGILFAALIAVLAFLAQTYVGFLGVEVYAITIGMAIGNLKKLPASLESGIQFSEKKILGWAVALLGLQLSFKELSLSVWLVPVLIIIIAMSILLGKTLAKRLRVGPSSRRCWSALAGVPRNWSRST